MAYSDEFKAKVEEILPHLTHFTEDDCNMLKMAQYLSDHKSDWWGIDNDEILQARSLEELKAKARRRIELLKLHRQAWEEYRKK